MKTPRVAIVLCGILTVTAAGMHADERLADADFNGGPPVLDPVIPDFPDFVIPDFPGVVFPDFPDFPDFQDVLCLAYPGTFCFGDPDFYIPDDPLGAATGKVVRQWWSDIAGTAVSDLTSDPRYPDYPEGTELLDLFEGPVDWANNYGTRLYGWLTPPITGDYTFWIAGDDEQQLWLSTDTDPANAALIARVDGWTNSREWDISSEQMSHAVSLEAGQKYYIEALGKEAGGGDSTAVAWQPPGGEREVIPGNFVDTYGFQPTPFASYPAPGALDTPQQDLVLSWARNPNASVYNLYFGTGPDALALIDTTDATDSLVSPLAWDQNYYWRVDPIPGDPGELWGFRTANFLPVDDFESYGIPGNEITDTWIPTGSTTNLSAERIIVYSGALSMAMTYYHLDPMQFSGATRIFDGAQDWTVNGGDTLSLRVRGHQKNDAQRLFVTLTDSREGSSTVEYPIRDIVKVTGWVEWLIPLSDFTEVDVRAVASMTIGVENSIPAFEIENPFVEIRIPVKIRLGESLDMQTPMPLAALPKKGKIYIDCIRIINLSGAFAPVGFWGHVRDTSKQPIPGAAVIFHPFPLSPEWPAVPNQHPMPGPGEYYIAVPDNRVYWVQVSAPGFQGGSFILDISATDANGKVETIIRDLRFVDYKFFDSGVAGCAAIGLDLYPK